MLALILLGAVLAFGYLLFRNCIKHLLHAEDMFPGPFAFPIIGNSFQLFKWRNATPGSSSSNFSDLIEYITDVTYYYRRSYRFWMLNLLLVVIVEPADVEKVYGNTTHIEKTFHYDFLVGWIGRGLLTSCGSKWKKHRKMLTPAFHFNILETFLDIFQRNGRTLCTILEDKIGNGNFDVLPIVKLYALDNICEAAMGAKVEAQLNPMSEYVVSIKSMCEIVLTRVMSPWLWPECVFNLSPLGRRQKKALTVIHKLTNQVISERMEEFKKSGSKGEERDETNKIKRRNFLDTLLQCTVTDGLKLEEIREEVNTFMFEGHDTVTSAISFALHCLAENPDCQQKAYDEQMTILSNDDREPTIQDLHSMKYLEMVIKETLRLFPSVPLIGRAVREDIILDERAVLPKGCLVYVIPQILHRLPWKWEKAGEFYPEHFDPEAMAKRHPYQYIPFSAGPRNCIGLRFAMLEMKSTLSGVLRQFRLLPSDPPVPLNLSVDIILLSDTGINIRIEKRVAPFP